MPNLNIAVEIYHFNNRIINGKEQVFDEIRVSNLVDIRQKFIILHTLIKIVYVREPHLDWKALQGKTF